MSYAEDLVRKWEKADPRDRWRYGLGKRPPDEVRNGPLRGDGPTLPEVDLGSDDDVRPDHVLHEISPFEWTAEEQEDHLRKTFRIACDRHPDIMEPYIIRILDLTEATEIKSLMRAALAETIRKRFPSIFARAAE